MDFPFGSTVFRFRAEAITDPYDPESTIPGDWSDPSVLTIPGASVQQTSTALLKAESREQALEAKSLFCEGSFDIRKGDRIAVGTFTPALPDGATKIPSGTLFEGYLYTIDGIPPAADTNPWTNWTPPREVPLTRYVG